MSWLNSLGPIGSVLRVIILIIEVLFVFNLMILVHEWGHFLAARWRGLKVEKFYIWFGKPLWKKTINGVEYGIGSIPAGGFVALPQMAPMGGLEGESQLTDQLPPITPVDKIIVAFAGPLFSFLLACAFALLVWQIGNPVSEIFSTKYIGYVAEDSPAAKAGLKPGDKVLTIDGHHIKRFEGLVDSVRWGIVSSEGESIHFEIERPGEGIKTIDVKAEKPVEDAKDTSWWHGIFKRPALREIGIMGRQTPMVAKVQPNSPASEAGIQPNDLVTKANGIDLLSLASLSQLIEKNPGMPVRLTLDRAGQPSEVTVTPRRPDVRPKDFNRELVGIEWDKDGKRTLDYPPVKEQVTDAVMHMKGLVEKLTSPKSDLSPAHMSGPVGIFRLYYTLFQHEDGWRKVFWFSVLFNINLAIMNMLPFPVLDGGHITMAIGEIIRRKPIQGRALEWVQTACALMLFGFMFFITFKDVGDFIFGGSKKGSSTVEELRWLPADKRDAVK